MSHSVIIVGAGIGGLAAAMRLAHAGCDVTVLERHAGPGGKMRVMDSVAGPVDAGPTVMTMRPVFERLFDDCGTSLDSHVTTDPLDILARHHWSDGSTLDLFADAQRSQEAISAFAGPRAARQFERFNARARALYRAFEAPMMQAPAPTFMAMGRVVATKPWLLPALAPGRSLAGALRAQFSDPRLQQLFGRYATYVGGHPDQSPALLSLIWHAESRGVWAVRGGMHQLAQAMQRVAKAAGAKFRFNTDVERLEVQGDRIAAAHIHGDRLACDALLFNGDPRALQLDALGHGVSKAVPKTAVAKRSLSAFVWSFAAETRGKAPEHHNVYFADTPNSEFKEIAQGRFPSDPTLYVCAQDRGGASPPEGPERFEIIINGPPRSGTIPDPEEMAQCRETTFARLTRMGLHIPNPPEVTALTTPEGFNKLFPMTDGSIYGLSPHGMTSALQRPKARTGLMGLYLCGGGVHPGAGIPMAATSGQHAAEAILQDHASTRPSARTAMPGGMSTASPRMVNAPSR